MIRCYLNTTISCVLSCFPPVWFVLGPEAGYYTPCGLLIAGLTYTQTCSLSYLKGNWESPICLLPRRMSWDCYRRLKNARMKPGPSCFEATGLSRAPHRWFNPHSCCDSGHRVTQHSPGIHKWFTQTRVIPMTPENPRFLQAFIKGKLTLTY